MLFRVFLGNSLFSTFPKQLGNGRKSEFFFLPKPTNKNNFAFSDVKDDFFCLFLHFFQKKKCFFSKLPFFRKVKIPIKRRTLFFRFLFICVFNKPNHTQHRRLKPKNTRDWCDFFGPAFPFCLVFFHFYWFFSILFWTFYFPFSPFFTFFFRPFPP